MNDDDVSAHRTRTNRHPEPALHPHTVEDTTQVTDDPTVPHTD